MPTASASTPPFRRGWQDRDGLDLAAVRWPYNHLEDRALLRVLVVDESDGISSGLAEETQSSVLGGRGG